MQGQPDFLIVGAMKAGTTRLYEMICEHPRVLPAARKEIHWFTVNAAQPMDWYLAHFPNSDTCLTGEASPTYLTEVNGDVVETMHDLFPHLKIIIITRDPVERAVSHFVHEREVNRADVLMDLTIQEFFDRPFPQHVPRRRPWGVDFYLDACLRFSRYSNGYALYAAYYGADNVLVLDNDELRGQPQQTMDRVFGFLGLPGHAAASYGDVKYSQPASRAFVRHRSNGRGRTVDGAATPRRGLPRLGALRRQGGSSRADEGRALSPEVVQRLEAALGPDLFRLHMMLAKRDPGDEVAEGADGWLYLTGGSNSVLDLFTTKRLSQDVVQRWVDLLASRAALARQGGMAYLHLVAPDKLSVYPEHFRGMLGDGPLASFAAAVAADRRGVADVVLDPRADLGAHKSDGDLYWRTDSHWNIHGCHVVYEAVCRRLGVEPRPDVLRAAPRRAVLRDLGRKFGPMRIELSPAHQVVMGAQRVFANRLVLLKEEKGVDNDGGFHVGSSVVFRNPRPVDDRKLLIFGDSFSEYRPGLLTDMLAQTFREVGFVWSTSVDWSIVADYAPDILLTEVAERFMTTPPSDELDVVALGDERAAEVGRIRTPVS